MPAPFPVHTAATAPAAARPVMDAAAAVFGFIPNLIGVMASSPALAEAYLVLSAIFDQKTALSLAERQVVLLAVSRFHECRYCVAAHTMSADMYGVSPAVVEAIRNDQPIPAPKLEALRRLVTALVERRGHLPEAELQAFFAAGYSPAHLLDALVGVAQKSLSNFTNHLAGTPLDEPLSGHAWAPDSSLKAAAR
jgi:uncharacterized peroxidase-related enzyme